MQTLLFWLIFACFLPLLIFWGFWLLLVCAAYGSTHRKRDRPLDPAWGVNKIDVLIPAHNEEASLGALLKSLREQNMPNALGSVLVVADHCTDRTAKIASEMGFFALERESGPAGKPGAVRDGLAYLRVRPHGNAVLLIDADCVATDNLIGQMAWALASGHAVSQSAYVLEQSRPDSLTGSVRWGFLLKNVIRPMGLDRLGLPCQLFGTGMMLRWDVIDRVHFEDHLVEDLRLSHDLLLAGIRAKFLPQVTLVSAMPSDKAALTRQRLRWEGGQFQTWRRLPGLMGRLLMRGNVRGMLALVDWSAPPLALAVFAWGIMTTAVIALVLAGAVGVPALVFPAVSAEFVGLYLAIGIISAGGVRALLATVVGAPRFLAWKIGVYARMATGGGAKGWERTPRGPTAAASAPRGATAAPGINEAAAMATPLAEAAHD